MPRWQMAVFGLENSPNENVACVSSYGEQIHETSRLAETGSHRTRVLGL
jgi:hypothetical protein